MAEETTPVEETPDAAPAANDATPSGKEGEVTTPKSFTQAEVEAIVKERLDRATAKAKKDAEKAQADAEAKTKAEQGNYESLWKDEKAAREAAENRAKELEIAGFRRDAAAKHKLPIAFVDRLKGETLEELEADAKVLAESLPKPVAPNINSSGSGSGTSGATQSEDELTRMSGVLGIPTQYLKQKQGG